MTAISASENRVAVIGGMDGVVGSVRWRTAYQRHMVLMCVLTIVVPFARSWAMSLLAWRGSIAQAVRVSAASSADWCLNQIRWT
jgi:hypothetical protein